MCFSAYYRLGRNRPPTARVSFGRRCWLFFWEVLCQAHVIRERPWVGLAHAFLLWGFGVFLLAEIDHFAAIFGYSFIDRDSPWGIFYFWLVFLFAFCCALSIIGLAFRRYIVKSEWLDPITSETTLTLALIFIIMVTLLPEWWIEDTSLVGSFYLVAAYAGAAGVTAAPGACQEFAHLTKSSGFVSQTRWV